MKEYSWNKKELNSRIKELEKEDLFENIILQNDIDVLNDMLKIMSGKRPTQENIRFKTLFYSNKTIIDLLKQDFESYITDFQNSVIINSLEEVCYQDYEKIYKASLDIPIKLDKQIDLIYKHFSDKDLYKKHKELFDPKNGILHITKLKNINETESLTHKDYICVNNNETVNAFKTLCHELGHYDERFMNNNRIMNSRFDNGHYKYENFIEICSIFYELLSIDVLEKEKIITPHDGVMLHLNLFINKTIDGEYYNFAKYCVNNNKIPFKDNFYIRKEFMFPSGITLYYYPFLIACILYKQYQKDPERACYNLNYILNNITPDNEKKVLTMVDANPEDLDKIQEYTKRLKAK